MESEKHARVLSGLHHVLPQVLAGDAETGKQTIDLLAQWFAFHLMTMDWALACALNLSRKPAGKYPVMPPDWEHSLLHEAVRRAHTMHHAGA